MHTSRTNITSFFKPELITIPLKADKEVAASGIESFIKEKSSSFFADIGGTFVSYDQFQFWLVSVGFSNGVRFNSKLHGQIIHGENGKALIKVTLKPAPALYIFFCFGIIYLVQCIIEFFSKPNFTVSFLFSLLLVPAFFATPFFIYHVSNSSTIERFKSFLKKGALI